MSVAAQEAVALGRLLERRLELSDPLDGLAAAFLSSIQELLESPWAIAETDFAYEQTRGARPLDLTRRLRRAAALVQLAAQDEAAHKLVFEVRSLLKPHSALREPWLEARVWAVETVGDARRGCPARRSRLKEGIGVPQVLELEPFLEAAVDLSLASASASAALSPPDQSRQSSAAALSSSDFAPCWPATARARSK